MYYNYNKRNIRNWLSDDKRSKELTHKNTEYLREFKQLHREFRRLSVITFTLIKRFEMTDLYALFVSIEKQKSFIGKVITDLKEYGVEPKWDSVFIRDIRSVRNRIQYVFRILIENLRLTEMYPYLKDVGFDRLIDFSIKYPEDEEACASQLMGEVREYNEAHPEEIERYMESVQGEIEARDKHRKKIAEANAREKEAKRLAKKLENEEVREIRENRRKKERPRHYGELKGL